MQRIAQTLIVLVVGALVLMACSGPEEKKAKFFHKGESLYEEGEYTRARLEFKNALQIDPQFARAYHMLGMVEMKTKNFRKAFGYFNKAIELDPALRETHLELGKLFLAANAPDRAREKYELLLVANPEDNDARLLKAGVLIAEEDNDAAQLILTDLIDKGFKIPDVYFMLASLQARSGDDSAAENSLREGIAANTDSVSLRLVLIRLYTSSNQFDKAIAEAEAVIAIEPANTAHKFTLASLYRETGQTNRLQDLLKGLIDADPKNEDVRMQVARFHMRSGDNNQAETILQEGLGANPESLKIRLVQAELFTRTNRTDDAINILETALATREDPADPEVIQVKNTLAGLRFHRNQLETAERLIDEVLQENPKNLEALMLKGQLRLRQSDGLNAISAFRTVVAEKPEFIPAYLQLSQAHTLNAEPSLALDTLHHGLKANPRSIDIRFALARLYASRREFGQAEEQLRKILAANPGNHRVRATLGDLFVMTGKMADAENEYRRIATEAPELPAGYIKQAWLHLRLKKPEQALEVLETGFERNPDSVPLFVSLVQLYAARENWDRAQTLCRQMAARYPLNPIPLNALGNILTARKDYDQAKKSFEKAIALQPLWQPPHNGMARIYVLQGKTDEAIARLETAIGENPRNPATYMTLGHLYEQKKAYTQARQVYTRALEAIPDLWPAANNLAFLISEVGKSPEDLAYAAELASKALIQQPENPVVLDTVGWIYYRQGDMQQAILFIEKAVEKSDDSPILNYHLATVLYESGRKEEARMRLEKALAKQEDFHGRTKAESLMKKLRSSS